MESYFSSFQISVVSLLSHISLYLNWCSIIWVNFLDLKEGNLSGQRYSVRNYVKGIQSNGVVGEEC